MADIEIVIKISEQDYELACKYPEVLFGSYARSIKNGIPLPKGHGRLIDESKIIKCEQIGLIIKDDKVTHCFKTDAPTIIEADKE